MGSADWTSPVNELAAGDVVRNVTMMLIGSGEIDGSFVYGFRAITDEAGFAGKLCNVAGFNPITAALKLGTIRAMMRKHTSLDGYSAMVFFANGSDVETAEGYMLGISEGTTPNLILKRGLLNSGLSQSGSYLRKSTTPVSCATWYDVKLEAVYNPQGDIVLNCWINEGTIASPVWAAIPGMAQVIDDSLGYLSGDEPPTGNFYPGFGMHVNAESGAVALFDYVQISKQDAP